MGHRLHLGRQQPHAPGHAVVERPGAGPGLRALPAAGRGDARDAAADTCRRWRRHHPPPRATRPGLHRLRMPPGRPRTRNHLLRGPRRGRQAGACARAQQRRRPAPPARARDGRVATGRRARRTAHRALLEARRPAGRVRPAARIERGLRRQRGLPAARRPAGRDHRGHAMDLRPQRVLRRPRHRRSARHAGAARGQRARCLRGPRR
ncbi:hypothetical protein D9M68_688910 [compost metagenome]